ncbi:universal stress protein [Kiloniella sp.]|uniref:universal stress protein n=1 Tax=Kiloniella sp. TaxID=1938587 RepID=UPI003B02200D
MSGVFVVAVDGSSGSERALQAAIELAKMTDAKLILAHVIEWSPFTFHTPDELAVRHKRREEELDRAREVVLGSSKTVTEEAEITSGLVVRHGHPTEALIEIAEETGASHIFIGRKGQSKIRTLFFGSVASSLVQTSSVPITVVP